MITHGSGMEAKDRAVVEQLFRERAIQVLCTTSTLALGVNLPAFLVVIKGTRLYVGSQEGAATGGAGYREYDRSTCLQMVGRAGRPQFDSHGLAVIMTTVDVRSTPSSHMLSTIPNRPVPYILPRSSTLVTQSPLLPRSYCSSNIPVHVSPALQH